MEVAGFFRTEENEIFFYLCFSKNKVLHKAIFCIIFSTHKKKKDIENIKEIKKIKYSEMPDSLAQPPFTGTEHATSIINPKPTGQVGKC